MIASRTIIIIIVLHCIYINLFWCIVLSLNKCYNAWIIFKAVLPCRSRSAIVVFGSDATDGRNYAPLRGARLWMSKAELHLKNFASISSFSLLKSCNFICIFSGGIATSACPPVIIFVATFGARVHGQNFGGRCVKKCTKEFANYELFYSWLLLVIINCLNA